MPTLFVSDRADEMNRGLLIVLAVLRRARVGTGSGGRLRASDLLAGLVLVAPSGGGGSVRVLEEATGEGHVASHYASHRYQVFYEQNKLDADPREKRFQLPHRLQNKITSKTKTQTSSFFVLHEQAVTN